MKITLLQKKTNRYIIYFVSLLFLLIFFIFYVYTSRVGSILLNLDKSQFKNMQVPCVITTFGRGSETISARISFTTPQGKQIGTFERSWNGQELYLTCVVFHLADSQIVFPKKIYSDKAKKGSGKELFSYYDIDDFPGICDFHPMSSDEKKSFTQLFSLIKRYEKFMNLCGDVTIQTIRLNSFEQYAEHVLSVSKNKTFYFQRLGE